jgi:hypothetical protein
MYKGGERRRKMVTPYCFQELGRGVELTIDTFVTVAEEDAKKCSSQSTAVPLLCTLVSSAWVGAQHKLELLAGTGKECP